MRKLLKPPRLRPGDRVGLVTPASPCPTEELRAGCAVLERFGLKVTVDARTEYHLRYLAGKDEERAARLRESLADKTLRALFCTRGGYGSMRILPQLPYALLRRSPRALVGFSDITALLAACCRHAGVVCFHGPTVSTLPTSDEASLASLWHALNGDEPVTVQVPEPVCLRPGKAAGPVLGGNLTMLCHLVGTRFFPSLRGALLFLEDRNEALYRIDRMLTHLIQAGRLAGIAGLMVGTFIDCGSPGDLLDLLRERLAPFTFPVLAGLPVGHGNRNVTLPLGLAATLDAEAGTLTYHEAATAP
ncbi:MAG TPA: LD-carboxypeptidase [Syntrophobacteria bacterium]|nr:LD-carboxypeptidase [Syntrophobacteria bacterium]